MCTFRCRIELTLRFDIWSGTLESTPEVAQPKICNAGRQASYSLKCRSRSLCSARTSAIVLDDYTLSKLIIRIEGQLGPRYLILLRRQKRVVKDISSKIMGSASIKRFVPELAVLVSSIPLGRRICSRFFSCFPLVQRGIAYTLHKTETVQGT